MEDKERIELLTSLVLALYARLGPDADIKLTAPQYALLDDLLKARDEAKIPTLAEWLASIDTRKMFTSPLSALTNKHGGTRLTKFVTISERALLSDRHVDLELVDISLLKEWLATAGLWLGMSEDDAKAAFRTAQKH